MTMLRLRGEMGVEAWFRRERQEACSHTMADGRLAFASGTIHSWRFDPEFDRYTSGPTYRRVCLLCDLVLDAAVPNLPLKDIIAQNSPSQRWMREHNFVNWQIEEREVGREEEVQDRYQQDQQVREKLRTAQHS
jgi:hypothetical protein